MKKIFSILLTLIAALGVFSCQTEKDADGSQYLAGPALEIVSKEVVFAPQGGSGSIVINTRETLSASADRSWATVTVAGNRVTVTVDRNESLESRYATIKLAAGGATAEVQAQQFGINSAHAWDDTYTFPYGGGELDLPYGENGTVWVDVSETNWISALVDEENHLIHFTVAKSIYNYERVGHVTVTIGDDYTRELTFIQQKNPAGLNPGEEEPVEFTVQPAWTPKYIQPTDPNAPVSTVGVDVAEGQSGGRYFIQVVPQADFNAAGADEQIFLNRNAATWAAASPRLFRATSTLEIDKLENGSYRVYAIGVNNDNEVNHTYAVATFNVTKVLSPYEKFLGTWSIQRGTFDDVWTIVEKEPGKSYTITGLEGGSQAFLGEYEITAEFDSSDNSFSIKTHPNLGQYTFTNSGESHTVTMRLTGLVTYNGTPNVTVGGNYTVCKVAITGDGEFTVTAGPDLSLQGAGGTFPLTGMNLNGLESSSAWTFDNGTPYNFPFKATQLTQGSGSDPGDDPGDDPGNDAYTKWLGTWNVGSGRTVTIAPEEQGKSYRVTDSGFGGFEYVTLLDSSTGEMLFCTQLVDEYDIDEYYFIGVDGNSLRYGDEDKDFLLARGVLSANGSSMTISPVKYMSDGQEVQASAVTILDYQTEDGNGYDQGWYGLNGIDDLTLPATLTKASSSALSVARTNYYDMNLNRFVPAARAAAPTKSRRIR